MLVCCLPKIDGVSLGSSQIRALQLVVGFQMQYCAVVLAQIISHAPIDQRLRGRVGIRFIRMLLIWDECVTQALHRCQALRDKVRNACEP